MPAMTPSDVETFLAEPGHLLRLATVDGDGAPYVVPIWFLFRDGRILVTPRERSAWWGHVQGDRRVALTVDEVDPPYRKVVVQDEATILHEPGDDDAWRDTYRDIVLRYLPEDAADAYLGGTRTVRRALLAIPCDPASVTTWRMPLEGEDPRAIWARRYWG
jgi:nitroimidazol reductase NimA-like FMN-containing flavoprotein (pyridoxamine 5'-phosphate oxidase superfamily)